MYHPLPSNVVSFLKDQKNAVLLETLKFDRDNDRSYLFSDPVDILAIFSPEELPGLLKKLEEQRNAGYFAAGYFGYECGYYFESIAPLAPSQSPIAWFGIYRTPSIFDHLTGTWDTAKEQFPSPACESVPDESFNIYDLKFGITPEEYRQTITRIKDYIRSGDTYQINFTTDYNFNFKGSLPGFYQELKKKQRVPYAAYIKSGIRTVLSLSPELFFRIRDKSIITKPMKGTVGRGRTIAEDNRLKEWLANDPKNQAENVMIVDLLRNDIGRVAEPGSVQVRDLFHIEQYETLFQMTSTVEGKLKDKFMIADIVRNMFPCGSVTGAPKIRSMQIIHELEKNARNVYTGSIGFFSPSGDAVFNVAIRTIVIDGNQGSMGVGSGIVFDSSPEEEYAECKLKGEFLTSPYHEVKLIESLLWKNDYPFLELHLQRLQESAQYFGFPCNPDLIRQELLHESQSFSEGESYKVRLTLDNTGNIEIRSEILAKTDGTERKFISISPLKMDSRNRFLYHKTTQRKCYDDQYDDASVKSLEDIVFLNENDRVTEGTRNNIFIRKGNVLMTPPVECGLLNGVYRRHLLLNNADAMEKILTRNDLEEADAIYLCNAVRGIREVSLR